MPNVAPVMTGESRSDDLVRSPLRPLRVIPGGRGARSSAVGAPLANGPTSVLEPSTPQRVTKLVSARADPLPASPLGLPRPKEPELTREARAGIGFQSVPNGRLTVDGISHKDPQQGEIGDCYFVSSLIAVAATNRSVIGDAIQFLGKNRDGDGVYRVRFFDRHSATTRYIDVTDRFPHAGGKLVYARSRTPSELWVPLVEKAFAVWKGSYDRIANLGGTPGGSPIEPLFALTGKKAEWLSREDSGQWSSLEKPREKLTESALFARIRKATQEKWPMVAGTRAEFPERVYERAGLLSPHAYALLGAFERDGVRYVKLAEPNRMYEWGNDGVMDGEFDMPFSEFLRFFPEIFVVPGS
jgi:hypothetical protein